MVPDVRLECIAIQGNCSRHHCLVFIRQIISKQSERTAYRTPNMKMYTRLYLEKLRFVEILSMLYSKRSPTCLLRNRVEILPLSRIYNKTLGDWENWTVVYYSWWIRSPRGMYEERVAISEIHHYYPQLVFLYGTRHVSWFHIVVQYIPYVFPTSLKAASLCASAQ